MASKFPDQELEDLWYVKIHGIPSFKGKPAFFKAIILQ